MIIKDLEHVKEEVKSHLPDYLEDFGRVVDKGNFACPNESAHGDQKKNPTAGFVDKHTKEVWHCFGCGERGDVFHAARFLENQEIQGQGFIDTLVYLADRFNVPYEQDERIEDVIKLHESVARLIKIRPESKKALDFLEQRNLTDAVAPFELGYCTWEGLKRMLTKHYDEETINIQLDSYIFKDRLVAPIRNADGKLVAFASRTLNGENRKWMNSSTSNLYNKKRVLYNLHQIKGDHVYVVEGYPDVWRLHINGYPAVAPCGTAMTLEHLDSLHERGIKKVSFCFDGDRAGLEASERIQKLISNDSRFAFEFVTLPKNKDPDELINERGTEAFDQAEREEIKKPIDTLLEWTAERIIDLEVKLEEGYDDSYKINWQTYMKMMEGVRKGLHLVGGLSNVGKTSFMLEIYKQLAVNNENLIPVFFSIDDDWEIPYLRLLASEMNLSINSVRNYKQTYKNILKTVGEKEAQQFYERRARLVGKYLRITRKAPIFDITKASKLEHFENIVKTLKEYTGKEVAIFVDNFHKIRNDGFQSTNERFTKISEELKRITVEQELVTFSTVEFRKLNHSGRPTLDDIKESVDIVYDSNAVFLLHNDMHSKNGDTELKFTESGKDYPIIEMSVAKNKLSAFKGRIYYRFTPEKAKFIECLPSEQEHYSKVKVEKNA